MIVSLVLRSSRPEALLEKGVLKICSKFTLEHPCRIVISIKLRNFIEIALWHGCCPVNLLHILRASFPRKTSGRGCFCILQTLLCKKVSSELCFILMHNALFGLVKMINKAQFWLVSTNKGVSWKKLVLNQNV